MIFTRIRMWGNLSNLGQWEKNPCVFFLFLFQPLSLRMVAGAWGSYGLWEWGGKTVSPHPHAHSTTVEFTHGGNSSLPTTSWSTHALPFHALLVFCPSTHPPILGTSQFCCSSLTQTFFLALGSQTLWWSVHVGEDWQSCHPTPKAINCFNHQ